MAPRKDDTPSFDFDSVGMTGADGYKPTGEGSDLWSNWTEVPQARFLSWPPAMQAAYCRDRDLHAAEAGPESWQQFYVERARGYDEDSRA